MEDWLKTEKIVIDIETTDLEKIDILVENATYANRDNFFEFAIRELLEQHEHDFNNLSAQSKQVSFDKNIITLGGIGVIRITLNELLEAKASSNRVNIMVVGLLILDKRISAELFEKTVEDIKVYGKIQANKTILDVIGKEENGKDE